ncbi:MAG: hypothetical protein KKA84_14310 [Bacteroidetes bacterium]|nr:hypothetical protein [Bacteroidota bacterium]
MKLRGNYRLLFGFELVTGILIFIFTSLYGDSGFYAVGLFFIGMALTSKKDADEREMQLLYKAGNFSAMVIFVALTCIYMKAPELNWFHMFASVGLTSRGIIGYLLFQFS